MRRCKSCGRCPEYNTQYISLCMNQPSKSYEIYREYINIICVQFRNGCFYEQVSLSRGPDKQTGPIVRNRHFLLFMTTFLCL